MEIKIDMEPATNGVRLMLASRGRSSVAGLAQEIGMKETTLRAAIQSGSLRLKDFVRIADTLGFTLSVKDRGEEK
ncbi:hypothetical protein [Paenibacillus terrae]|uniref:HTH cro/C1-type domain-containing protein n=1 Tax=Paenibacillus terrae TaxID=159743 RepID=A0A0D7WX65_9BACL|nr:hypothetical protein [Paenibacillus terrae]KJD43313.1 hypothetical protein QD47_23445 [Paenibacillus terrae]